MALLRDMLDSDWQYLDILYVGVPASQVSLVGDHGAAIAGNDDLFPGRLYRVTQTGDPSSGPTFMNIGGDGYHVPAGAQRIATQGIEVFEDGVSMGLSTAYYLNDAVTSVIGEIAAGTATVAGVGMAYAPGALTGTGAIAAGTATLAGTGATVAVHTGSGNIQAGDATISTEPALQTGYLQVRPSMRRPKRRETEAYRRWIRGIRGESTEEDLAVEEAMDAAYVAPMPTPLYVEMPVYEGEFFADIPMLLPAVELEMQSEADREQAMREARLRYLRQQDEELLLLLAGAKH